MMKLRSLGVISLLAATLMFAGCSQSEENMEEINSGVDAAQSLMQENIVKEQRSLVEETNRIFLSRDPFKIQQKTVLPSVFHKSLVYTTGASESFTTTVANISKITHVPISMTDDARDLKQARTKIVSKIVNYQGTLEAVLNQLANEYGLYWKEKNGAVQFFALETKVYSVDAPVGDFTISNSIDSSSDSSADSGADSTSTTVSGTSSMDLSYKVTGGSPWAAVLTTVQNMLSANGKMHSNPVEGYVTVTDNPMAQEKVAKYIARINSKTNKKIAVKVDVYDVETTSDTDISTDFDNLVHAMSQEISVATTGSDLLTTSNTLSSITFAKTEGSDHDVVLSALNSIGKASETTSATVYTISGEPAPLQSTTQENYLEEVESTTDDDGDVSTSTTTGTIVVGYSMMITPRIQSNNQILVNLNLQLSTLESLETFDVSESDDSDKVQLPTIKSKNFLENMVLHSGQSLLIAGFTDNSLSSTQGSPFSPDMWALGGGKETAKDKSTTVIVITPYIISD